ncbi:putative helicase mug81 [Lucilia cuprina]|nr:putative helicase mug81 [Lucilia cuprina]
MVGFENLDFAAEILAKREDLINSKLSGGLTGLALKEWKNKNRLESQNKAKRLKMIDSTALLRPEDANFPHVYRKSPASNIQMANARRVLPAGTSRESLPVYERVVIPASDSTDSMPKEVLIHIKDMDEICQITFSKYKTLNPVQSLVYPVGYETNENMLICAPTGAGKTDIALLALLRAIQQGKESERPWKAVYVAPLKALAAEITEKMGSRLAWMNIKVRELTVLIGSPTGSGKTIACEIAVLAALRDHPHMKIVYVAPMKALVRERVDDWKSGICTAKLLPNNKFPKLVELTGDSQPTSKEVREANLVVTTPEKFDGISRHSHWATNEVSLVILDEVHLLASDRGAILEAFVSRLNRTAGYKPRLHTLQFGIALHHAGLDASDRKISHRLFAEGKVQILCATSTLAWGVNLPAYLVVVKGTQFYDTKAGGYQDMSLTDVLQMMGRAGRPRFNASKSSKGQALEAIKLLVERQLIPIARARMRIRVSADLVHDFINELKEKMDTIENEGTEDQSWEVIGLINPADFRDIDSFVAEMSDETGLVEVLSVTEDPE